MTNSPAGQGLRIALASQYPDKDGRMSSGVAGVVSALADGLAAAGVETHVVTCVRGQDRVTKRVTPRGVTVHSVPSLGRLAWLVGFPVETAGIRSVLKSLQPDLVHVHTQTVYAHAALERDWPSIITIHGIYSREVALMKGWRRVQGRLLGRFERDAFRRMKHVVCINEYLRRKIGQQLRGKDLRLIENPVDDRYFEVPNLEQPGRILYAGTIINRKNLLGLLDATRFIVASGGDVRVRVVGSQKIEPGYYSRCVRFVERNGLASRVDFVGTVPIDGMIDELSQASMLVLASYQETAPMVVSEAMAAGRPIVATPAGGTAEMVGDGEAGLVVPFGDSEALADAIKKLIADDALRAQMGARARQLAEDRHRLSTVVTKTIEYYRDVLGEERIPAGARSPNPAPEE